ncbi:MAG: ATP-binding protein, partial [Bacteroidota bacterium]
MEITKEPKVNAANEFLEIANDFTNPLELVRESISNSFDANATEIHIYFNMVKIDGEDVFEIKIRDNGEGISEPYLENFFDLGNSSRKDDPKTIGEKGHGTKVYFNSRKLALKTVSTDSYIEATMEDIFKHLNNSVLPKYKYSIKSVDEA